MATKHRLGNWYLNEKGYPRFCSGKYRNRYVHRVVVALSLGRELKRDEDVHHRDGDKLNFRLRNLKVLGHQEHGWVSAAQHWYMNVLDIKAEQDWKTHFDNQEHECPADTPTSQPTSPMAR